MRFNSLVSCALLGLICVALPVALAVPLTARDSAAPSSHSADTSLPQFRTPEAAEVHIQESPVTYDLPSSSSSSWPDDLHPTTVLFPRGKVTFKVTFDFGKKTVHPTPTQQSTRTIVKRFILDAMGSLIQNVEFNIEFENDWIGKNTEITFSVVGGQECPAAGSAPGRRSLRNRRSEGEGSNWLTESVSGTMGKRSGSGCHGGMLDKGAGTWVLKNSMDRPIYGPVPQPKAGGK
ncbi:hypothetical protein LENED_003721 [Lentinula edodes]|uniref:Uncharacterized protein n=1 Tax=Lentinula edodes TaxID=5353 RepID=A0A1Q3E4D0_LENED|nr:hypothetical protein LENED_003721 [Lentinula edodes]